MKKKILFYGNCQAGVLGQWLYENHSSEYNVADCEECGLQGYGNTTKNFAVWSPENSPNQKEFKKCILSKIKECDIFVFHNLQKKAEIEDLRTQNLCSTVAANKLKICLPNARFSAYPICRESVEPFIKYIFKTVTKDPKKIFQYLVNENDPFFEKIIEENFQACTNENIKRYESDLLSYENVIDMNNFISNNWKKHLLFGTLVHPIGLYWIELLKKIAQILEIPFDKEKTKNIRYPNIDGIHDPRVFSFFNKAFPNIIIPDEIQRFYKTDTDTIKQIIQKYE